MHVLQGGSPEEKLGLRAAELSQGGAPYDHPFFGQILMAGALALVNYPHPFDLAADSQSIVVLNQIPRIIVGVLAVFDTFLIYKIADLRYGRKVGFFAAVLFAVMPIGWLTRRIWLDNLQLPFMLSALLLVIYLARTPAKFDKRLLLVSSGVLLGLAIFIKLPAVLFLPLILIIILKDLNTNTNALRNVALILIPAILIPSIWPAFAIVNGEFNIWVDGILWQAAGREDSWADGLRIFLIMDPIFAFLGAAGIIYSLLKKDVLPSILVVTYLVFYFAVGYASYFHFIPLIPVFCLAGARLIADLSKMFNVRKSFLRRFIPYILIAEIGTFGLINTGLLISMNLTSHQFLAAEKVVQVLPGKLDEANTEQFLSNSRKSVTIVGNPYYHWIPQKVYHIDQIYTTYLSMAPLRTQYFVIIVDDRYRQSMLDGVQSERLAGLYNTTRSIAVYQGHDLDQYEGDRYYHEILKRNYEQSIEVRTNY